MFRKIGLIAIAFITSVGMVGCGAVAASNEVKGINASGMIEANEISINSKLPGRIEKILVKENDTIEAGTLIAQLACDEIKAKEKQAIALVEAAKLTVDQAAEALKLQEKVVYTNIDKAQGALDAAQSQYDKAKNGARVQEVAQLETGYNLLKSTYERMLKLQEKGAVTAQKVDEVKAQLDISKQRLDMAKEGARPEDIKGAEGVVLQAQAAVSAANAGLNQIELAKQTVQAAKAKYDQAVGGLEEVRTYLSDAVIKSPIKGYITILGVKEGELVSSGMSIATISEKDNTWVTVKVKETDMSGMKEGQEVSVTTPAYKEKKFSGKIVRIERKPDFAAKRSTNERDEKDITAFGVKIEINNTNNTLIPGMTAYVSFDKDSVVQEGSK